MTLSELQEQVRVACKAHPPDDEKRLLAHALAKYLPLTHRAGVSLLTELDAQTGPLSLMPGSGSATQRQLGTHGNVFLWVGAPAYTQPPVILVLDAKVEASCAAPLTGSPWDTGGLPGGATLGFSISVDYACQLINDWSLPFPDYRDLLAEVLAYAFVSPWDYLEGRQPRSYPPFHRNAAEPRAVQPLDKLPTQTFEVRHSDVMCYNPLALVVDEASFAGKVSQFRAMIVWAKRQKIEIVRVSPPSQGVLQTAREYIDRQLRKVVQP